MRASNAVNGRHWDAKIRFGTCYNPLSEAWTHQVSGDKPFRGLEDDDPYTHIKEFTMICNTVQQGVPTAWFKWNIFPFSLEDEAWRWYTLAFVEAKGNWDELVKRFLLKFFPISKVQDLRRQVLTFKQGEDEGIDEAWDRFNELL
jgi:hypothetical protein